MTDRGGGSVWWLYRVDAWLQLKAAVFEDVDPSQALGLSLLRLHSRLLGCRFGSRKTIHFAYSRMFFRMSRQAKASERH